MSLWHGFTNLFNVQPKTPIYYLDLDVLIMLIDEVKICCMVLTVRVFVFSLSKESNYNLCKY